MNGTTYNILIIGGGVIGLSVARELRKSGINKISIVERGRIGEEASWAAGGMLSPDIESDPNGHFYRFCRRSLSMYSRFAEELFDETGIDIELDRAGTLSVAFGGASGVQELFDKQREAGANVRYLTYDEILKIESNVSEQAAAALFYPDNWQVENRKMISALRVFCERNQIEVCEDTPIERLIINDAKTIGVETARGEIYADQVVLATGAWTSLIKIDDLPFPFEIRPILGQMICFKRKERLINSVIHGPRGYLVPRRDGRIIAGSTSEDRGFEKGVSEEVVKELHSMAAELVPALVDDKVVDSWSGLRPCSADKLPVIGGIDGIPNLTVATGHYRNGILLAPLTAEIVANALSGIAEYSSVFSPNRFLSDSTAAGA